ncbi:PREDICTED: tRNA (guanine-N(7)-)-methyltransferase non-catalytic subunit wdr4-like [Branchiostoma belcheri]|uniref:tRNA (guanine-N(7)-)-methyltransferase non-catalytic subunit n=1 Tax=Branchiostoma belcheri TaxID=7741 RepID=A0A6P5AL06_BRABE|nr:PREDICTED: tRNA (guanine-N(7)-)-methyltransferase non-catalytic subunit wdr4-like [Branchiostoma belcheri]
MASLVCMKKSLVVESGNSFKVYDRYGQHDIVFSHSIVCQAKEEKEKTEGSKTSEEKGDEKVKGEGGGEGQGSDKILARACSVPDEYFAVATDNKELILWKTTPTWKHVSTRTLARRCTALVFTFRGDTILAADKSGDVYSFSVSDPEAPGTLLLGHLSMLLDIAIKDDDSFLVTCDRDEKIRISHYPNTHSIYGYCLGHTEYITALCLSPYPDGILLSGGGDGTVRVWDWLKGKELHVEHLAKFCRGLKDNKPPVVSKLVCNWIGKLVAVVVEGLDQVILFKLHTEVAPHLDAQLIESEPLECEGKVWDVAFDRNGYLWVAQAVEDNTVQVYKYMPSHLPLMCASSEEQFTGITTSINSDWDFFKSSLGEETMYSGLYKKHFDNLTPYFERKEERMKGKKRKEEKTSDEGSKKARSEEVV